MITFSPKFTFIAFATLLYYTYLCSLVGGQNGKWQLLLNSTGVVPMHMTLTHQTTVIMYDQTGNGPSSYPLRNRYNGTRCTLKTKDLSDPTCYAHSVEYDIKSNRVRSIRVDSDLWCSSGAFLSNGTLVQTGGYNDGSRKIRYLEPCRNQKCDWSESGDTLSDRRWYSTNQILPERDRVIVIGGKNIFTYEFVPKLSSNKKSYYFPFLRKTRDRAEGGLNLYPFVHLSSDGNLFVFANRDSILFDYKHNKVVKKFPRMPGGGARNYPNTGSSVLLPLHYKDNFTRAEVMVCGGSATGAYSAATKHGRHLRALKSCGRIVITGNKHDWKMENMPEPRLLNDMIILPTGRVLIINGAKKGCAGYDNAVAPSLNPYLYNPEEKPYRRFSILESTYIPRMYHSSAILLPDGRVLVSGGNPHSNYTFENVDYPTELRLEVFIPDHMDKRYNYNRPRNVSIYASRGDEVEYGEEFGIRFQLGGRLRGDDVAFSVYAPPFATHSNSMNQRMLVLRCTSLVRVDEGWVKALVEAPPSPNVAPPGYYLVTVVNGGIPSVSRWVRFI